MSVNPSAIGKNKGLSELWKRLRFVLMAVIIYRVGTHIPIPGIDPDRLANLFQQNQGTLLDYHEFARRYNPILEETF